MAAATQAQLIAVITGEQRARDAYLGLKIQQRLRNDQLGTMRCNLSRLRVSAVETEVATPSSAAPFVFTSDMDFSMDGVANERQADKAKPEDSSVASGARLEHMTKTFNGATTLKVVNWWLKRGEKVSLVTVNGVGKTTQSKIIAGPEVAESGTVINARENMNIAFLTQEYEVVPSQTLREEHLYSFGKPMNSSSRIQRAQLALESSTEDTEKMANVLHELDRLQKQGLAADPFEVDTKINRRMNELGFSQEEAERLVASFSAVWKMRMELGKILIEEVLLDEHINHVDLGIIKWLGNYLEKQDVPMVIVSRDHAFLDFLCSKIVETDVDIARNFEGNFFEYVNAKAKRIWWQALFRANGIIQRLSGGANTRRARSAVRQLERKQIWMASEPEFLKCEDHFFQCEDKIWFENKKLLVENGQKIAINCPNECGQSALLRLMMCHDEATSDGAQHGAKFNCQRENNFQSDTSENEERLHAWRNRDKKWGEFAKACKLRRPRMVDEVHLRRLDDLLENGGAHRRVVASITVEAPIQKVWAVLTEYECLSEFIPNLASSKIMSREKNRVRLVQEGCKCIFYMILHARVVLDLWEKPEREILFQQVEGDFDSFQGKWALEPLGSQHTLLKYVVDTRMQKHCILADAIVEKVIYEDLPANLCAIRDRVELCKINSSESLAEIVVKSESRKDNIKQEAKSSLHRLKSRDSGKRFRVAGLQNDFKVLELELSHFIKEHGKVGIMPTRSELRCHKRVDLEKAMTRMGGFSAVAARMGLCQQRRPRGYWDNFENVRKEIVLFLQESGLDMTYMPTRSALRKAGRLDVARALEKWGGAQEVARLMGLKVRRLLAGGRTAAEAPKYAANEHRSPMPIKTSLPEKSTKWNNLFWSDQF